MRILLSSSFCLGLCLITLLLPATGEARMNKEKISLLSVEWATGPVATKGKQASIRQEAFRFPKRCIDRDAFYKITGLSESQKARCRIEISYGPGGAAKPVKIFLEGDEEREELIPTVLSTPVRKGKVICYPADRFEKMNIKLDIYCSGGKDIDGPFAKDLYKYLDTE